MTDLQEIFRTIDSLNPEEFEQVLEHIEKHKRTVTWWVVPPENLAKIDELMRPVQEEAATMSEEEINSLIDDAITEVRRERRKNQSSG